MMAELRDQLQQALGSEYVLKRELGGGGMSRVFLAEQTSLKRSVVVKLLSPDLAADLSSERFTREIRLAAMLQQANIVPVLTAGVIAPRSSDALATSVPYFTMPFVEGESLRGRLSASGPIALIEAVSILRDVARALAYAHARGIVHRDIKPDNVLLSGGTAMVADFGVAKAVDNARAHSNVLPTTSEFGQLTRTGVSVGTPGYMAPEQAAGDPATDHRADIYAFGCLAFEMLTGETPFGRRPPMETLRAHLVEAPPPLTVKRRDAPPALVALVRRCLEKSPAARPGSAAELLQALDGIATPGDLPRYAWPRPRIQIAAAIIVAFAAIGAGGATYLRRYSALDREHTIAIIPLASVGTDTTADLLPDVITDEVHAALARAHVPRLALISQNSADQFRGKTIDLARARRTLGTDHILELRVRHAPSSVIVRAELVNAENNVADWSNEFAQSLDSVHSMPEAIANGVIAALGAKRRDVDERAKRHEPTSEAQFAYFRGRYIANRMSGKHDLDRAMEYFDEAMHADPQYAEPYAAAARMYSVASGLDSVPPDFAYSNAERLARRALELDSANADAHAALGWAAAVLHWDWRTSAAEIKRAIALDPNNADGHSDYAWWLMAHRRLDEAANETRRAMRLDPTNNILYLEAIMGFLGLGALDSALVTYRRLQDIMPGVVLNEAWDAEVFRRRGMLDSALSLDRNASRVVGRPTAGLVISLAALQRKDEALQAYEDLIAASKREFVSPEIIARAALAAGRRNEALDWLEKGTNMHSDFILVMPLMADLAKLHTDPRYQVLMRRIGLAP